MKKMFFPLMSVWLLAGIATSNCSRPGLPSALPPSLQSVEQENTHGYIFNIATTPQSEEAKGMEVAATAPYQENGEQEFRLTNRFQHLVYTFGKMVMVL